MKSEVCSQKGCTDKAEYVCEHCFSLFCRECTTKLKGEHDCLRAKIRILS